MCVCFKVGTAVADHERRLFRVIRGNDDDPIDHEDTSRSQFHKADVEADTTDINAFINEHKHILKRQFSSCDSKSNPCAVPSTHLQKTHTFDNLKKSCKCQVRPYCNPIPINGACAINATWLMERLGILTRLCA